MARPIANAGAELTLTAAELPKLITLDGSQSADPDGDPITGYQWQLIGKPEGSAAVLANPATATPSFTADLPGTYLAFLVVTAGVDTSDGNRLTAPASAWTRVTVPTVHRGLIKPATGERDWGERHNRNLDELDRLAGVGQLGAVELDTAPAGRPVALGRNNPSWATLTAGPASDASALHTHVGLVGIGRHHDLRPDLLTGPSDRKWTSLQVAGLKPSQYAGGTRAIARAQVDGLLELTLDDEEELRTAAVLWAAPAGDFTAICDLRLDFGGDGAPTLDVSEATHHLLACFAYLDVPYSSVNLASPTPTYGAGLALDGAALPLSVAKVNVPVAAWNASLLNAQLLPHQTLLTEFMVRLVRKGTTLTAWLSLGGGGWLRVSAPWAVSANAGTFALGGLWSSYQTYMVGWEPKGPMRLRSTGFRLTTDDGEWWS